jgi:hypothetical protein
MPTKLLSNAVCTCGSQSFILPPRFMETEIVRCAQCGRSTAYEEFRFTALQSAKQNLARIARTSRRGVHHVDKT